MKLIWFGMSGDSLPDPDSHNRGAYFADPDDENAPSCYYRVSTEFDVVDGRLMPLWLEIEGTNVVSTPSWGARVELVEGVPKIVTIGFATRYGFELGREVKPSDFQVIRSVVYDFYAVFCAEVGPDGQPVYRMKGSDADKRIAEFLEQRRTGRQRLKTDDYKRAAQIYRENFDGTPTQAVADAFGVGLRQGGNIVAECRRRRFLPPTKQGRKKA